MPLTRSDVHVDAPLGAMALGFKQMGLVSDVLFPQLSTKFDSGSYYSFGRRSFGFANEPEASFAWEDGSDWNVLTDSRSTQTYSCVQYAAASVITNMEIRNQDSPPLSAYRDHANFCVARLNLILEAAAATKATSQGNYPATNRTQLSGTSQWSDYTSGVSDPINDIITGANAIRSLC